MARGLAEAWKWYTREAKRRSPHLCTEFFPIKPTQVPGSSLLDRLDPNSPSALQRGCYIYQLHFLKSRSCLEIGSEMVCKPWWGGGNSCNGLFSSFALSQKRLAKLRGDTRGSSPSGRLAMAGHQFRDRVKALRECIDSLYY